MSREKGLLVVPATGNSWPFSTLASAEAVATVMVERGKGPVEIRSRYTGDVLATYREEEECLGT